ncbi:TRIM2_3 [Mytilus coruscus]|uniref:TRIM2_3 n=1 Tax=Mytilus coruscus TaxID=42192 RepID=A0A6J8AGF9_MYTCO|nr:TRIM2_3 [Mytilus coruscus]
MEMNIETEIKINMGKNIDDMICLMDGRVIVVEWLVTNVIAIKNACWGISCFNNSLAVGLNMNKIHKIDLEGNTQKSLKVQSKSSLDHLLYCNDRIIFSDYGNKAVYCIDLSGKQIWQYKQDLERLNGLCKDTYGNIIVADWKSIKIVVISSDGQDSKVMLRKEDQLKRYTKCIC